MHRRVIRCLWCHKFHLETTAVKTTVLDQTRKSLLGEIEGSEAELNDAPPVLRSLSVERPTVSLSVAVCTETTFYQDSECYQFKKMEKKKRVK